MCVTYRLHKQLKSDVSFLERVGVMDYSLLLGIHFCARAKAPAVAPADGNTQANVARYAFD